jgi:hypothetical protein
MASEAASPILAIEESGMASELYFGDVVGETVGQTFWLIIVKFSKIN